MKITLLNITFKKELIHWNRMGELFNEMTGIGGVFIAYPILVTLVSICHYAFAIMHTSFELVLFFVNRKQFKENMQKIYQQLEAKQLNPQLA